MRKLFVFIVALMVIFISACTVESIERPTVIFKTIPDITVYQYEDDIDFMDGVVIESSEGENLNYLVTIDSSEFNTDTIGTTIIYYRLQYQGKSYEKYLIIEVIPEPEEPNTDVYFTVSFNANGGTTYNSVQVLEGSHIQAVPDPIKTGFIFEGWYSDSEFLTPFDFDLDVIEANTTLYAKWKEEPIVLDEFIDLNIYYINDLHGAVLPSGDSMGLANIANLVLTEKDTNPENTIFIAGGDILQGQLISNYYTGASVIDILNHMELDAFVIGNHEFDWGIDKVLQYFNGENEIQANYPLLGANVYNKDTNQRIDNVEPYTIIERSGLKIAIIGTIGYGLESSISFPRIEPYYFYSPGELTGYYAEQARLVDGADIVLAVNHDDDTYYNNQVAGFSGNRRVDAIFNGHTHTPYVRSVTNQNRTIHTIQSAANGTRVGNVSLTYNTLTNAITSEAVNLTKSNEPKLQSAHPEIADLVSFYEDSIHSLLYDPYMTAGSYMSQGDLAEYIAKLMQQRFGADVGIHNTAGTRASISNNESITYAKLFQISPFDNQVITGTVKGSAILSNTGGVKFAFKNGLSLQNINPTQDYVIATNDYIFYNLESPYKDASHINVTGIGVLDLFVEVIENLVLEGYTSFNLSLPIIFNSAAQRHHYAVVSKFNYVFA